MIVFDVSREGVTIYGGHPELDVVVIERTARDQSPGVMRCSPLPLASMPEEVRDLVERVDNPFEFDDPSSEQR